MREKNPYTLSTSISHNIQKLSSTGHKLFEIPQRKLCTVMCLKSHKAKQNKAQNFRISHNSQKGNPQNFFILPAKSLRQSFYYYYLNNLDYFSSD